MLKVAALGRVRTIDVIGKKDDLLGNRELVRPILITEYYFFFSNVAK